LQLLDESELTVLYNERNVCKGMLGFYWESGVLSGSWSLH